MYDFARYCNANAVNKVWLFVVSRNRCNNNYSNVIEYSSSNWSCSANRFATAIYFSRFNINNDFYVNAWRCAECS